MTPRPPEAPAVDPARSPSRGFAIGDTDFLLDGQPFRILSGALHYFRVHPDLWRDRIDKARQMGLNTIETYVPWNLHEPERGAWTETGALDLARFLDDVAAAGMRAIVRPGPYICAEVDNGGLPAWLFAEPDVGIRRAEPRFLAAVASYLERVLDVVVPRQADRGGPVILVQVENEYGAYGSDRDYLGRLVDTVRAAGVTVPLTSVDQPEPEMLVAGSHPELHMTASFGSRSVERLRTLREHQPSGPLMCSEYWDGWFDSWGEHHHTTPVDESASDLAALLATGASVNLYMFHGGTNFALTNGANDKGRYAPIATSYDYDAPLDEAGSPTPKYWAYREVLRRFADLPADAPEEATDAPTGDVPLDLVAPFLPAVLAGHAVESREPPSYAALGLDRGFAIQTTPVRTGAASVLSVGEIRDRVTVVVDGIVVGVLARESHERAMTIPPVADALTLLVENEGRVDYGPRLGEDKGVIGGVRIDGEPVLGWSSRAVTPADVVGIASAPGTEWLRRGEEAGIAGPALATGRFEARAGQDRFLDTGRLGRGIAWVNGFCLGRYWSRGPQRTLYVPGPVIRDGSNELLVLELAAAGTASAAFAARPDLGHTDH